VEREKAGRKTPAFLLCLGYQGLLQWRRPLGFRFRIRKRRGVLKAAAFSASIDEIVDDGPALLLLCKQANAAGL
jgi:hypothetical protein